MNQPLLLLRTRRGRRGLTLLELAIGLAVLAILGALALPSMGARLERQRVLNAAQMLAADLNEARFEAARRGQALNLQGSTGAQWCWAVATTDTCDCSQAQAQTCQIHTVRAADHPGVQLLDVHPVRLEPVGWAQATSAATLASRKGEQLRVDVSGVGRPRVCALSGSWPNLPAC